MTIETILYVLQIVVIVTSMIFSLIALVKQKKSTTNSEEQAKINKLISNELNNCVTQIKNLSSINNLEIDNKTLKTTLTKIIKKDI